jgi:DNA-binding transcriptional regulator YiaG
MVETVHTDKTRLGERAMPNIANILKSEIVRLAGRVTRGQTTSLKKASAAYRREIAALKRQLSSLQRDVAQLKKRSAHAEISAAPTAIDKPIRFVAKGLRSLRKRLSLSAPQLATLLGVSPQSVYNWETKVTTPRKEQVFAIAGLRQLGKREAHARLATLSQVRRTSKRANARK